jgi:hypothetical protein
VERIVWPRGFAFGYLHYPAEVITSLPRGRPGFKALEAAVWFDYVVLPRDLDWADDRPRYERLNADDPDAPVKLFRRVR